MSLFSAEKPVNAEEANDCCGCNFDSATTATGVCADEHDDDKEEERGLCEVGNVDGIEACGTACECHEQHGLGIFSKGVPAKEVVVFGECKDGNAYADDDEGSVSGNASVQRKASDFLVLKVEEVAEFCNGEEPKSARKHQDASSDVDDGVVLEANERVGE